ncbi:MAG TPA: hypothetical protein VHF07_05215, partial [Nitrospiraceae bacterium]|nr:hypothetical protein [Nitrospiraceae bacterium]
MSRRSEFRERGYLHIRHFFPEETVDEVRHDAQRIFVSQLLRLGLIATSETAEDKIESAMYLYFRRCPGEFMNCGKQAQYLISLYAMGVDAR